MTLRFQAGGKRTVRCGGASREVVVRPGERTTLYGPGLALGAAEPA
ncbi:hypothetical protein ACRAWD_13775 [Caulobacter segnis]